MKNGSKNKSKKCRVFICNTCLMLACDSFPHPWAPHILLPRIYLGLFKLKRSNETSQQKAKVEMFQNLKVAASALCRSAIRSNSWVQTAPVEK